MEDLIKEIVQKIAREVRPQKIILFGSRAAGRTRPDSDVDLLLIYDGPLSKREIKLQVHRLFAERNFSLDLFVLSANEYERQKGIVSTVGRVAAREGVVCYG
jgi:predicted nucleotidyltransferase